MLTHLSGILGLRSPKRLFSVLVVLEEFILLVIISSLNSTNATASVPCETGSLRAEDIKEAKNELPRHEYRENEHNTTDGFADNSSPNFIPASHVPPSVEGIVDGKNMGSKDFDVPMVGNHEVTE